MTRSPREHGPAGASDGAARDDAARLAAADELVGGEAARRARRQGLYAGYVFGLFAAVYGFPLIQALFRTSDSAWLRDQLTRPATLALSAAGALVVLGIAYWSGGFRGPVVPPLPWIDLVVTAPIDRALTVRRWWRFAVAGGVFLGGLSGLVVGSGLAFAQVTGPLAIAVTTALGLGVGVLTARVWLAGQVGTVRSLPVRVPWRVPDALRTLRVESLRRHSANTSTLAGSAYSGNLRTARLAFARPVRRARAARLRPGRPVVTLLRRDLLGLRRQPASAAAGLGLLALGSALFGWTLGQPAAPVVTATVGMLPLYLGFGILAEGLRLQADNVGSPSLIGSSALTEAAAHLVVPSLLSLFVVGSVGTSAAGSLGGPAAATMLVVLLLAGGHLQAAFRGAPRIQGGPTGLAVWYLQPATIALLLGTALAYAARSASAVLLAWSAAGIAAVLLWGLVRVRRLTLEHRI